MLMQIYDTFSLSMTYLWLLFVARYIFLEPKLNIERWFSAGSIVLMCVSYFLWGEEAGALLCWTAIGLYIFLARTKRRIRGFFRMIPIMGICFGLMIPFSMIPEVLLELSSKQCETFDIIIDLLSHMFLLLFLWKGKNWRSQFEKERLYRTLGRWESYLLNGAGLMSIGILCWLMEEMTSDMTSVKKAYIIVLNITLLILTFTVVALIFQGNKKAYYHGVAELNERYLKAELKHFRAYQDAQKETRRIRHDMKNHMSCLAHLAREGNLEELKNYLEDLNVSVEHIDTEIHCGNTLVDAICNEKYHLLSQKNVTFEINGQLPTELHMEPVDLCTIFANALDNVVEALEKVEGSRWMQMDIRTQGDMVYINLKNPYKKEVEKRSLGKTTKQDELNHGFGLQNMKMAVEKYHGEVVVDTFEEKGQWIYSLDIMLMQAGDRSQQNNNHLQQNNTNSSFHTVISSLTAVENNTNGEKKMEKKLIRRDGNRIGWALLLYTVIEFGVILAEIIIRGVGILLQTSNEAEQDRLFNMMEQSMDKGAVSTIIGAILGTAILFLCFRKTATRETIFRSGKKMTLPVFAIIFTVFMSGDMVGVMTYELIEKGLNLMGYTAEAGMDIATETSTTVSMFLYAGIVGPIVEELLCRGIILRRMEKHGKVFAIMVSAILFGIMHGNLPQALYATLVGIVLAYVALEYSIWWTIGIHILNNLVFCDLLSMALGGLSEQIQDMIDIGIMGILGVIGIYFLWKYRKSIQNYLRENKTDKVKYLQVFSAVGIVAFLLSYTGLALLMIEKL